MTTESTKRQASATKRQAEATKSQAKQTVRTAKNQADDAAETVKGQAEQTARAAEKTIERAGRTFTTVLVDGAYASLGATDSAIAWLRSLPNTVIRFRHEGPGITESLQREFDSLAIRGRQVVDTIASSPATQRAVEQTRAARHQIRTAAGQVRKTAETAEDAVEDAANAAGTAASKVGGRRGSSAEIEVEVSTPEHEVKIETEPR